MTNDPAFAGAQDDNVVSSSHAGDGSTALGCIPLQEIDGEDLPHLIHSPNFDSAKSRTGVPLGIVTLQVKKQKSFSSIHYRDQRLNSA